MAYQIIESLSNSSEYLRNHKFKLQNLIHHLTPNLELEGKLKLFLHNIIISNLKRSTTSKSLFLINVPTHEFS